MGYARLYFPNDGTRLTATVVHDIVGVVCGNITSTASLTTAWANLSSIVNTLGSNWSLLYPSTTLGTTANTSRVSWVIRSPCVSSDSKFKYVRIAGHMQRVFGTPVTGSWPSNSATYYGTSHVSSTEGGIWMTGGSAATNANTVVNESFVFTNAFFGSGAGDNNAAFAHNFRGNTFHISWSQRHLVIWGGMGSTVSESQFVGFFEHTETPVTTWRNTAPYCALLFTSNTGKFASEQTANVYVNIAALASKPNEMILRESLFLSFDHYSPVGTEVSGIENVFGNVGNLWTDMPIMSNTANCIPSTTTVTSTGATAMYVQPLHFHQYNLGIPQMYISSLSNVYRVIGGSGTAGDTVTIGANTFVYLPTSVSSYSIIVPYE